MLPQRQTRELLRSASLVVSPRTEGDNTPLKVYEQLACGIPLIATDVPAHTQVLDGKVCFLAPPDAKAFSQALVEGLTNQTRREQVVVAAKALFCTKYSKQAYLEKVSLLLDALA
jgi:glycosyltransferase involved in cell wall biosynthesis